MNYVYQVSNPCKCSTYSSVSASSTKITSSRLLPMSAWSSKQSSTSRQQHHPIYGWCEHGWIRFFRRRLTIHPVDMYRRHDRSRQPMVLSTELVSALPQLSSSILPMKVSISSVFHLVSCIATPPKSSSDQNII